MTPPEQGVSTNIWQNFAETLKFEDLAVIFFYLFLLREYFCEKNCELVPNPFFSNVKKKLENILRKTVIVFKGFKGRPSKHTKTFFSQNV